MDASSVFKGKKITVMGLGLLGRGVGDAVYLASCGAELVVTDVKTEEALAESVAQLERFPNVTFVLGEHRTEDFVARDFVLKAAGVPLDSPYVQAAREAGVPIKMSASWFAEIADIPVIGVTGTRGKSTTTHMLHAVLKAAGKHVLLGGNVRGVSTLALLPEVQKESIALLELDSWQLQGFGEDERSPNLAIFTTFMRDHMNYYHDDMKAYLADKANIFRFQSENDTFVLGSQCAPLVRETYPNELRAHVIEASEETLPGEWRLAVPGEHNRYAAGLTLAAARALQVHDDVSQKALEGFAGVSGRLELIAQKNGVQFYNDTTATTPDATIAALKALAGSGTIHLIMGGADKGLSVDVLTEMIQKTGAHPYLLAGTGTDRIKIQEPYANATIYSSMNDAVSAATGAAKAGDVVVLSPGFASFGLFNNEYDRGDQFTAAVHSLV